MSRPCALCGGGEHHSKIIHWLSYVVVFAIFLVLGYLAATL